MYLKIFGYGFLLFIATMATIFLMSILTGTEDASQPPFDLWWLDLVAGIILACASFLFARRLKASTTRQALMYGIIWAVEIAAILLIICLGNGTTSIFFGQWSVYFIFVGVAIGPIFNKPAQKPS